MSTTPLDLALDYLPRLPRRKDFGIGCIGAGFIMRDCHLVAYRQAGFNPVAITSRDPARARAVAETHALPRWYGSRAELLADPAVEVLDIAVPPDVQPAVIREAIQHAGCDSRPRHREESRPGCSRGSGAGGPPEGLVRLRPEGLRHPGPTPAAPGKTGALSREAR